MSYQSVAEVQFESDLSQVVANQETGPCEAEILMKFFEFYGHRFDREKYAIDIRSGNVPYPVRTVILGQIQDKFAQHPKSQDILG